MSDDESTQPIDIEALRATAKSLEAKPAPRPSDADVLTPVQVELAARESRTDDLASVTRIEHAPVTTDDGDTGPAPSTTRGELAGPPSAMPLTRQADSAWVRSLAGKMDPDPDTQTELPEAFGPLSRIPSSVARPTFDDVEVTNVTAGGPARDDDDDDDDEDQTTMGRLEPSDVARVFEAAEAAELTAAFRGAPPSERAADDDDAPRSLPRFALSDDDELDEEAAPTRVAAPYEKPVLRLASEPDAEEPPSSEVFEVLEDEVELLSTTGSSLPHSSPRDAGTSPLPSSRRVAPGASDAKSAPRASDPDARSGVPSGSVEIVSFVDSNELANEAEPPPDSELATNVVKAPVIAAAMAAVMGPAAPPAKRPSTAPPPAAAADRPPHRADPDAEEIRLFEASRFDALLDLYRRRAADADTGSGKARWLVKASSVLELELLEPQLAFDTLLTAFDLRPHDDEVSMALDRLGRKLGRITELSERARKHLPNADHETRVALLGHLIYWYERCLSRGAEIGPFVAELERLDKTHPFALRKAAQIAAANGDHKSQRELLGRALERTGRRDEKVHLHLALAGAHGGTPESAKHYEAAFALDPTSMVALQGLERIGREHEKHAQVEWSLEHQIELAETDSERVDALLKLAALQETKFLRRERAAELLERVVELEPSNPSALKALERCYHALREWPKLARILRARAENTYDKKAKIEQLELAAEVYESKLGELEASIEAYKEILEVDPKHRRALGDIARLSEKLAEWSGVATYKAMLAQLAPTKRQASRELVLLGDFLAERAPELAKREYDRATEIDPTNAAAWEALQRIAAAAGDERRVLACLDERVAHLEAPRQRAAALVELAQIHASMGNDHEAKRAFESAIADDPGNETAAAAVLDAYTREEKWDEAAPLAELLVNAAVRDADHEALFTRLRLQTRIGAAMGDADKAVTAAIAAMDARPDDPDAQTDLVAVCSQCRNAPDIVLRAKTWLMRIAEGPVGLPADTLTRLAQLQRDTGEGEASAATLERALAIVHTPEIQRELADVYVQLGDFPRACKLILELARNATSAETRFALFVEAGDVWAKAAGEPELAASVYEEARRIKPLDRTLLHTLMALYTALEAWDRLSTVLGALAEAQDTPDKKAKSLLALAQVMRDKIGDAGRAADLFDQALDLDPRRLEAFEELVRLLTTKKDWDRLERAYRKMIARADEGDANLRFALYQQLGLIYRDRLGNAEQAFAALEAAARLRPGDAVVRRIVTELLVVTDNLDNAVVRLRELVDRDPHDPHLYAELYELFLRQHQFDKAWCVIDVLGQVGDLTDEQRGFHADYAPTRLSDIPGQIVEQAWASHLFHRELDPILSRVFAFMTPGVARMRQNQLRPELRVGRPFTPAHSIMFDVIRETFTNAAEILGVQPPELLLGDPSQLLPFTPALAPVGAVNVSVPAIESRADCLVYVIGKRLAEQRPELLARAFFNHAPELAQLLGAAVRAARNEPPRDALDATLGQAMAPNEREAVRVTVAKMTSSGDIPDVTRWIRAADLTSMRAALLVCGEVAPARKSILAEPQSATDLSPREKIGELYRFATSDLYSDLRGAIGINVAP